MDKPVVVDGPIITARKPDDIPFFSDALIAVYGTDYGIPTPTWISRFTDMTRQAAV